jgi:hypothetical protein
MLPTLVKVVVMMVTVAMPVWTILACVCVCMPVWMVFPVGGGLVLLRQAIRMLMRWTCAIRLYTECGGRKISRRILREGG